jgi:hypothetical protein
MPDLALFDKNKKKDEISGPSGSDMDKLNLSESLSQTKAIDHTPSGKEQSETDSQLDRVSGTHNIDKVTDIRKESLLHLKDIRKESPSHKMYDPVSKEDDEIIFQSSEVIEKASEEVSDTSNIPSKTIQKGPYSKIEIVDSEGRTIIIENPRNVLTSGDWQNEVRKTSEKPNDHDDELRQSSETQYDRQLSEDFGRGRRTSQFRRRQHRSDFYDYDNATYWSSNNTDRGSHSLRSPLPASLRGGFGDQLSAPVIRQPARRTATYDSYDAYDQQAERYDEDEEEYIDQSSSSHSNRDNVIGKLVEMNQTLMNKFSELIQPSAATSSATASPAASVAQPVITSQPLPTGPPNMDHRDDDFDANLSQDPPSLDGNEGDNLVPPILRRDPQRLPFEYDDDEYEDDDKYLNRRLSEIFISDRVGPILRTTAELNGLDDVEEIQIEPNALRFGSLSFGASTSMPLMQLPIEVGKLTTTVSKSKKLYVKPPRALDRAFRVSQQDQENFFVPPRIDDDVKLILSRLNKPNKVEFYSKFWENEMLTMDIFMRSITRVAAFQLAVLNATMIDLQPLEGQQAVNEDFAIPSTLLATDMAGQVLKLSVNLSHRLTRLRRQNACAGVRARVIDMVADELLTVDFDTDPTRLFGGLFDKTSKKVAKRQEAAKANQRRGTGYRSSSYSRAGNSRGNRQSSSYSSGSNASSRGYKRKQSSQYQTSSYDPPPKRGRGQGRGRGQRRGRGRGGGGGQSRV